MFAHALFMLFIKKYMVAQIILGNQYAPTK